jgi:Bacterial regulatory helix-turn-helix protein, lysR family
LFIAQPALSQQMQRLEQIAGTPPLQRRRDRVRLTAEGTVLLEAAREFEPDVRISSPHPAARCGVIGPDDLAGLDVIRGPRRASPATYDRWLQVLRTVDPRFEFTRPPFRHSLPTALAFAATASRPGALLTGPAVTAGPLPGVIRLAARRAPATWPGSASPPTR